MQSIRKNARFVLILMAITFILWIFLELGMNIAGYEVTKPYQRGIIAEIDKVQVSYDSYQDLLNELIERERNLRGDLTDRDIAVIESRAFDELLFRIRFSEIKKKRKLIVDDNLLNTIIMNAPPPEVLQDSSFWIKDSFDVNRYREFLEDPANRELVLRYAKNIIESYPIELMNLDITSMLHISKDELEKELFKRLTDFSFKYYQVFYLQIPDTQIKFNDDSLKNYYEKNKKDFKKEGFYKIGYVKFELKPSKSDSDFVLEDLREIRDLLINKKIDIFEANRTYNRILRYKKDTTYSCVEGSRKYETLGNYKEKDITEPVIIGDTAFIFFVESKGKKEIKYRVLVAVAVTTSYETRMNLKDRVINLFREAKSRGLKVVAESHKVEYVESGEIPYNLPFIPGVGENDAIIEWIKKSKKGSIQKFWTPDGFYIIEILDKKQPRFEDFEEVKSRVKFMYLRSKKEKLGLKISEKILKGEVYDTSFVVKKDFKDVNFYDRVFGLQYPDRVYGVLINMNVGEKRRISVPGSIIIVELLDKSEPSTEKVSAKANEYYERYLSSLQNKVFSSFYQELKSREGVRDYRSNFLE
ncbi:MAG: SurA N-terminal domain-containing protein [Candidatus Hydrothermales bacterium]